MPNYYLSVLYKHIIQVENKNLGLKVGGGGTNIPLPPPVKKVGGHMPPLPPPPPPPRFLRQCNSYTYSGPRGSSVIDYLLSTPDLFPFTRKCLVCDFNEFSDHAPLLVELDVNTLRGMRTDRP